MRILSLIVLLGVLLLVAVMLRQQVSLPGTSRNDAQNQPAPTTPPNEQTPAAPGDLLDLEQIQRELMDATQKQRQAWEQLELHDAH